MDDPHREAEVQLTKTQLQLMEKLAKESEAILPESPTIRTSSGDIPTVFSPKIHSNSGNKFKILSDIGDDLTEGNLLPESLHKSPDAEVDLGENEEDESASLSSKKVAELDLPSEDDSIDTSMPLSLIIQSKTRTKKVHSSPKSYHTSTTSTPQSPLSPKTNVLKTAPLGQTADSKELDLKTASTLEGVGDIELGSIQTRQYNRGTSRGRPRGRGNKNHR